MSLKSTQWPINGSDKNIHFLCLEIQQAHEKSPLYSDGILLKNNLKAVFPDLCLFIEKYRKYKHSKYDVTEFQKANEIVKTVEKLFLQHQEGTENPNRDTTQDPEFFPLLLGFTCKNKEELIACFQCYFPQDSQEALIPLIEAINMHINSDVIFKHLINYYATCNTKVFEILMYDFEVIFITSLQIYPGHHAVESTTLLHLFALDNEVLPLFIWSSNKLGIPINQENAEGKTPFALAIERNNQELIEYCITQEASIYPNETPFYSCCKRGKEDVALNILQHDQSFLHHVDADENTMLHKLIQERNAGTFLKIAERNLNCRQLFITENKNKKNPLQMALENGYYGVVLQFFPEWMELQNLLEKRQMMQVVEKEITPAKESVENLYIILKEVLDSLANFLKDPSFYIDNGTAQNFLVCEIQKALQAASEVENKVSHCGKMVGFVKRKIPKFEDEFKENLGRCLKNCRKAIEDNCEDIEEIISIDIEKIVYNIKYLKYSFVNPTLLVLRSISNENKISFIDLFIKNRRHLLVEKKEIYFLELAFIMYPESLLANFSTFLYSRCARLNDKEIHTSTVKELEARYPSKKAKIHDLCMKTVS